jgi:hypothetical protein
MGHATLRPERGRSCVASAYWQGAEDWVSRKARRSFETIIVDKKVAATLGDPEDVTALLEALAKSFGQAKKKRRAA